jgi:signal recognition particle subunit SRP68
MMATKAEKLAAKNELQAKTFSLEILSKIKSNQMQHGIRHGDYNRYSQYCTKRMHRIRKKLKFHHGARFKKKIYPS